MEVFGCSEIASSRVVVSLVIVIPSSPSAVVVTLAVVDKVVNLSTSTTGRHGVLLHMKFKADVLCVKNNIFYAREVWKSN